MLTGKIHHLLDLGLGDFIGKDAADTDAPLVHMQHDTRCFLAGLVEKPLENVNNEFHGSVIVIQHKNPVHRRLFRLCPGFNDDTGTATPIIIAIIIEAIRV